MNVSGLAAIVTGGASGLGAETARQLAKAGAKVTLLDMNEAAATEIAREFGGLAIACDVTDPASAQAAIEKAEAAHGVARILINCAGIAPPAKILSRNGPQDLAAFSKIINVNLIGTFNMIRLFAGPCSKAEALDGGERGVIISTASVAAFEGQIGQVAYAASKAGVVGMLLPVAREFATFGIRACAIAPGIFETPMLRGLPPEVQASLGAAVPFPSRLGKPEEYAHLAMAIINNPMLNGEVIRLDGAIRMQPK